MTFDPFDLFDPMAPNPVAKEIMDEYDRQPPWVRDIMKRDPGYDPFFDWMENLK